MGDLFLGDMKLKSRLTSDDHEDSTDREKQFYMEGYAAAVLDLKKHFLNFFAQFSVDFFKE